MPEELLASPTTQSTFQQTPKSSVVVFSTLATWGPKTQASRLEKEPRTLPKPLEGTQTLTQLNLLFFFSDVLCLLYQSYHTDLNMDTIVTAIRDLFSFVTNTRPKYKVHGGTQAENLALQNIQVRSPLYISMSRSISV
jgi:hypothetical protein